jgi:hypothetical protein
MALPGLPVRPGFCRVYRTRTQSGICQAVLLCMHGGASAAYLTGLVMHASSVRYALRFHLGLIWHRARRVRSGASSGLPRLARCILANYLDQVLPRSVLLLCQGRAAPGLPGSTLTACFDAFGRLAARQKELWGPFPHFFLADAFSPSVL